MSKSINQHLSLDNRNDILKYVKEGFSLRKIASIINCSPSTITRKLKKRRIIKKPNLFNNYDYKSKPCKSNRLTQYPWICNGCENFKNCRKERYVYDPNKAHTDYKTNLSNIRKGPCCNPDSFKYLNHLLTPKIKDKGFLEIKNIDLPRRVRYKTRKKTKDDTKTLKAKSFIKDRTYLNFKAYIHKHKDASVYEMDSVECKKRR